MHTTRLRNEAGETLMEIVIALVIISLVIGAYFAAYATVTTGSKSQKDLATADALLRNSAETTKSAVRDDCAAGATYTPAPVVVPSGFSVTSVASPAGNNCPAVTTLQRVTFTVTLPNGSTKTLAIDVRTP
jgi:Tfp pilus assembly protein PilW